jgi:hypothetical protein
MITNTLPRVTRSAVEARLKRWSDDAEHPNPVIALRGAPEWDGDASLNFQGVQVPVRTAQTVLGVLEALADHAGEGPLVLITSLGSEELGASIRARLHGNEVRTVDHWDTVLTLAGATRIEPALASGHAWLAEAAAGIGSGLWEGKGKLSELRRDTLLARVAAYRLDRAPTAGVDAAALLEYFARRTWSDTWSKLPELEREGLTEYLAEPGIIGPTAPIILGLAEAGHEVIPLGLTARELYAEDAAKHLVYDARIRFEGRYFLDFKPVPDHGKLRLFGEQTHGVVERWREDANLGRVAGAERAVVNLLESLQATGLAAESTWLDTGRDAAASQFAVAAQETVKVLARLDDERGAKTLGALKKQLQVLEDSFTGLAAHQRTTDKDLEAPRAALRLLRWLSLPRPVIGSVAAGLRWQIGTGGWVDRARSVLRAKDTTYGETICTAARERRRELDREFAGLLRDWGGHKAAGSGLLCVEDILDTVAEPLAKASVAPLLLVVDGMSAADAASLAEGILDGHGWTEVVDESTGVRAAALSAMPSETRNSRVSLLSGALASGGQLDEDRGFKRFWNRYSRHNSVVLHKDDLRLIPGRGLPEDVRDAIADTRRVVAAILNQIDDALDADERIAEPEWQIDQLDLAKALLEEAARAARPVILCSDHGNIRDSGSPKQPGGDGHSRWRPGSDVRDGEVVLNGGRLSVPGPICVAVDEEVRYISRKAGYHGGASLAEAAIPVLAFIPVAQPEPKGWIKVGRGNTDRPLWWHEPVEVIPAPVEPVEQPSDEASLFEAAAARTGAQVVASRRYEARQKIISGNLPEPVEVARIIDQIEAARWKLPLAALADRLDVPAPRFARKLAQVKRLLNEPGAEVLMITDSGQTVEINMKLLRSQFLGGR